MNIVGNTIRQHRRAILAMSSVHSLPFAPSSNFLLPLSFAITPVRTHDRSKGTLDPPQHTHIPWADEKASAAFDLQLQICFGELDLLGEHEVGKSQH